MSVVSSVLSTRSTGWRINVRFSSLMDSIFAIGFGLALRFVVDTVSHHDFKLTGTLVGLWEGVIMLHFLKKMPKSSDPYIAYGVRLFIDFLFTESLARTVLVLIWTALGMVLADITPAIWEDVGLKRIWKSFRRDLYTISRMIPTVAFFPPARTVRFSPSREPSVIVESTEVLSPSEITQEIPISNIESPFAPVSRSASKRRLPGYLPQDYSDTETDPGSVRIDQYTAPGRTSRRLSVYPQRRDSDVSSDLSLREDELDEANLSSFPSDATETGEQPSGLPDASEIPDMQLDEEPLVVNTAGLAVKPEDGEVTPTQKQHPFMPPTPSDSAPHWGRRRDVEDPLPVRPPSEFLPQIPDFLEEATTEEWEKIQPEDYEKPPTPPAKDKPVGFKIPKVPLVPPPEPPITEQSHTAPNQEEGWDTLESQVLSRPPLEGNPITEQLGDNEATRRLTLPPSYDDVNFDDIYDDPPRNDMANDILTGNLLNNDADIPPTHVDQADAGTAALSSLGVDLLDPWNFSSGLQGDHGESNETDHAAQEAAAAAEEALRLQEEQENAAAEAAAQAERERQQEEEAAAERRKQEEEAATKEKEKKEKKAKKAAEKAEREKKELEDELARKQRVAEAEEAERQKIAEQRKKDAEAAKLRREEKKKAEEEKKKREEEEKQKKREEEEKKKREEEEAERKRQEEEAEKKRKKEEEEEAEKRKAEEAEKRRKEEEQRLEQEKRLKEQEEQRIADEAVQKAIEEEAKAKEEEQKRAAEAQNPSDTDQKATNGNGDIDEGKPAETQHDTTLTQEQLQEQLTPTMSPRNLDESAQGQVDAQESSPVDPVPDAAEEQSVISDAQPPEAEIRVERMLLLRAQMVDIQSNIEKMKLAGSDYSGLEKVLQKMEKKAQRRYAQGTPLAEYLDNFDPPDTVDLGSMNAQRSRAKIAEKIEQLLDPASDKLFFNIQIGKKAAHAKLQKPDVTALLTDLNLLGYCKEAGKKLTITVPDKEFTTWLTDYRISLTRSKDDDGPTLWK